MIPWTSSLADAVLNALEPVSLPFILQRHPQQGPDCLVVVDV